MALETYGGGWATGKLLLCDDPSQLYSAGRAMGRSGSAFNIGHAMPDAAEFGLPREVFGAPCAAPLISRAMIGDVVHDGNLFDPLLSLSGEDSDLMWRARRLGWACWYVPNAVASHLGSAQSVSLRVEALSNRWLSCVKNAYPVDLVTLHAPQISLSLVARLILTPRTGFQLARRFFSHVRPAWRNRRPARIPRRELAGWWRWSARQPSLQSRSLSARLSDFLTRRFRL